MTTSALGRDKRTRTVRAGAVRVWLLAAMLAAATPAARCESTDLYAALRINDCAAIGRAVNSGMEREEPDAYYFAGYLYDGTGCVADDPAKAARFYRRAMELGYVDARNALGRLYGLGRGVPQDYAIAYRWYTAGSHGEPAPGVADPDLARLGGYAITVAQVALVKARYPADAERNKIEATLDAVFDPSTGRVTISNAKAAVSIGSNVGRSGPFRNAVEAAYTDAIATVRRPDDVVRGELRFSTPWRFGMKRSLVEDRQQADGVITVGDTVALSSSR